MKVRGIVWAGTRTEQFAETDAFFRDVLGVPLTERGPHLRWARGRLPDSSQFEVFGPADAEHRYFSTGPVVEFLIEDIRAAIDALRNAGVELLGVPHVEGREGWVHFRAPDGNVYGLTASADYSRLHSDQ